MYLCQWMLFFLAHVGVVFTTTGMFFVVVVALPSVIVWRGVPTKHNALGL